MAGTRKVARSKRNSTRKATRKTRSLTVKTTRRGAVSKVSPALAAAIEKVMNRDNETKYVAETIVEEANFNSGIGSTNPLVPMEMYRALPLIYSSGGTSSSMTKLGKQIQPVKCTVNFRFNFDFNDRNAREIRVVLYMLNCKNERAYYNQLAAQPFQTNFLDDGQGSNVRFQGTYLQSKYPIDKENWSILHKRTFALSKGVGLLNDNTTGTSMGKYREKNITLNVRLPKRIKYDENTATPAAFAPVWAVGYYYADNTAPDLDLTAGCLHVTARTHMWFKDS